MRPTKTVDDGNDRLSAFQTERVDKRHDELFGELVSSGERDPSGSTFAVDADAELDFVSFQGEGRTGVTVMRAARQG